MAEDSVFYTNPMSRGRIVRWMLEEVGRPYVTEFVQFGPPMKGEGYKSVNPMGKVPAIRHGDIVVTEAAAICAYLAEAFPEAGLAPKPAERGPYYRWMFFAAGPVEQAVTTKALDYPPPPPERRGMVGYGTYEDVVETLAKAVSTSPYIAGDRFTAADVYVGAHIGWGMQFGGLPERPEFESYWARLRDREAAKRAAAIDDAALAKKTS